MNIFLLNSGGINEAKTRAKVDLKFEPKKSKVVEPGLLEVSLPCLVAILGAESSSSSLEIIKPCRRYF